MASRLGMTPDDPLDEMVDGAGGFRPHWRWLLGALATLGRGELAARGTLIDAALAEEDGTALLPGRAAGIGAWRCDPVPLLLAPAEFDALEAGLAQRARLLEALLRDVYGPQRLLAEGALPPALVFANPAFLRPCRDAAGRDGPLLHVYAADLLRDADGGWRVVADRTATPAGLGRAMAMRRALTRHLPELARARDLRRLQPFFDVWQDALQRLAPSAAANPGVALLTAGHASPHWQEDVLLARLLSCALVEGGDLTVRDGALCLKTLRGLQRVDVVLRRLDGRQIDPLEVDGAGAHGVPGLLDAARGGALRIVNDPGTGCAEAPALAAFLPDLAQRLLGTPLLLPSARTLWLGDPAALADWQARPDRWLLRHALDGTVRSVQPGALDPAARASLLARVLARPSDWAASERLTPSCAPCAAPDGMQPRPILLRLFLLFDGRDWRAMPGGLASVLDAKNASGARPGARVVKDVWITAEDAADIQGPRQLSLPAMPIRRTTGDLPSRVADNFFWLGRYLERLETAARLLGATVARLATADRSPREVAELRALAGCLLRGDLLSAETAQAVTGGLGSAPLARGLLRAAREGGPLPALTAKVAQLTDLLRDRLTGEMHHALQLGLRDLGAQLRGLPPEREEARGLERLTEACAKVLAFTATVAGFAAENMVRSGGRLFLDLGRRIERAQAIAAEVARALDQPGAAQQPARLEPGLRLALELRDSVITYRSRYFTVLQPAPVLDLVLADAGNPRGLAFQLAAARDMLHDLDGDDAPSPLVREAARLIAEVERMVEEVAAAPVQAEAAAALPPRLLALEGAVAALSDGIGRRWFTLLPAQHTVGPAPVDQPLRGAA